MSCCSCRNSASTMSYSRLGVGHMSSKLETRQCCAEVGLVITGIVLGVALRATEATASPTPVAYDGTGSIRVIALPQDDWPEPPTTTVRFSPSDHESDQPSLPAPPPPPPPPSEWPPWTPTHTPPLAEPVLTLAAED